MYEIEKNYCEQCGDQCDASERFCSDECEELNNAELQDEADFERAVYYGRC
jgi:predicted nucleic acid-binding Zn ribbon protein